MRSKTAKPFADALRDLKAAHGLTYRELAEKTRELDGKGMTANHITQLATGHVRPSTRAMELLARACGVEPDCFAEYRTAAPPQRSTAELGEAATRPFGEALRGLKEARGLTYLELADRTRGRDGKGLTAQYLNLLVIGRKKPSTRAIEQIARACDVQPDYFAEYRLAETRDGEAPNRHGDPRKFGEALRALKEAQGLTYRELSENMRQLDGTGVTPQYLGVLASGVGKPSQRVTDLIARACGVAPDYFARYRPATRPARKAPDRPAPAISSPSTKPFPQALRALLDARGLTHRELAERTRRVDGKGITRPYITLLANGRNTLSMRTMELLAGACGVQPEYFAEYRLAVGMRDLDPSQVGLARALENLDALRGPGGSRSARARSTPRATRSSTRQQSGS
jgi:transcriptional regulator with XRE-family HTH domain